MQLFSGSFNFNQGLLSINVSPSPVGYIDIPRLLEKTLFFHPAMLTVVWLSETNSTM